jgi:hypothetical protein
LFDPQADLEQNLANGNKVLHSRHSPTYFALISCAAAANGCSEPETPDAAERFNVGFVVGQPKT